MQRRDFIRTVFLGASALAVGPGVRALAARPNALMPGADWAAGGFEQVLGESFRVRGSGGVQTLVLDQAQRVRRGKLETVSLRFTGKAKVRLAEGCYEFQHSALGTIAPHIVPGTVSGSDCHYRMTLTRFV